MPMEYKKGIESMPERWKVVLGFFLLFLAGVFAYKMSENKVETMTVFKKVQPPDSQTTSAAPGYTSSRGQGGPFIGDRNYPADIGESSSDSPAWCTKLDRRDSYERTSVAGDQCRPGTKKIGFSCYAPCGDGWKEHPEFPETCHRCKDYSETCDFLGMLVQNKQRVGTAVHCRKGYEKFGGLCYPPCKEGYKAEGNLCIKCMR